MATKTDDNQNDAEPEEIVDVDQESEETSSIEEENIEEAKELSPLEQLEEQIRLKDEELANQKDTFLREKAELENRSEEHTSELQSQ